MEKSILCFNLFTIVGFATLTSCNNEELKRLKDENAKLKRMYANLALDLEAARYVIEKKL